MMINYILWILKYEDYKEKNEKLWQKKPLKKTPQACQ
jgi:hypothetical protein